MSSEYFKDVKKQPCPYLKEKLHPNLVKALIASESSFRPNQLANPKNSNSARSLMQVTNVTRKTLADE